ncbi:MAG TPA: hypothetical protein VHM02_01010, partial [Thermoanaerobaculia bacterium]|nr:hypothetical protein [Thermoanaerobaculia bacterium]
VAFLAVAVAGARRAAARAGLPRHAAQGTVAAVALATAGFGIGYRMAGAADWPIAAALLVALPALLPPGLASDPAAVRGDRLRLGLAAALAAGAKIEGVPLAALLVAAGLVGWRGGERRRPADLARLLVPPLLVVLPWVALNLRHGLFAAENTGPLDPARLGVALAAAAEAFATREWLGLPWLLLLLPLALAMPRTRRAAAVLLLQAGFYGWVYLTSPVDTRFLVLSSLPRLLLHLLPPFLVLLAAALFGRAPGEEEPRATSGADR